MADIKWANPPITRQKLTGIIKKLGIPMPSASGRGGRDGHGAIVEELINWQSIDGPNWGRFIGFTVSWITPRSELYEKKGFDYEAERDNALRAIAEAIKDYDVTTEVDNHGLGKSLVVRFNDAPLQPDYAKLNKLRQEATQLEKYIVTSALGSDYEGVKDCADRLRKLRERIAEVREEVAEDELILKGER